MGDEVGAGAARIARKARWKERPGRVEAAGAPDQKSKGPAVVPPDLGISSA